MTEHNANFDSGEFAVLVQGAKPYPELHAVLLETLDDPDLESYATFLVEFHKWKAANPGLVMDLPETAQLNFYKDITDVLELLGQRQAYLNQQPTAKREPVLGSDAQDEILRGGHT